ncbi:hypothetical protein LVY72_02095 [Arthrobacter sp. I2-34]|uniref:Uncharacterized protein n=1 Tax=Arthrobacter hankyongi TaxID=2904801 RepID=A0ABS9L238_9MICC|nr:spore germination protein GerW family protein [Arthrobacter hankyongi]MCG2620698.1 hypothetical protein [Arthrobacter hankyongi]
MTEHGAASHLPILPVQLAEQFKSFGVARSFGEPVRLGDETVVPVALVQYGFGGGQGHADDEDKHGADDGGAARKGKPQAAEGSGGGGGGIVIPVGVLAPGRRCRAVFRPNPLAVLVCLVPVLWAGGHAVARVAKALRS